MDTSKRGHPVTRLAEQLIELEHPKDVIQAAGQWMAYRLERDSFRWLKSRTSLERRLDGRLERIQFEGSRWNKSGKLIEFSIVELEVFDEGLEAWRRSNPNLTVERPESVEGIVCATSFLDISQEARAIVTHPSHRIAAIDRLCEHAREVALPWFSSSGDPENLASATPEALLRPTAFGQDLLEFLVSRGLYREARTLIQRFYSIGDEYRDAISEGRNLAINGGRPIWHSPLALGWSSEVLGLL
ncbi:hypothetical protein [Kitasatospora sp. MBT66]|uniref:hypothetical protein n=1 Tax=Kitasatospora sp. MBT66 TaxID=1444769 RepID=UPI0011EA677D|nr:hypothetical protein [Kitasatospora sp. MBT66]